MKNLLINNIPMQELHTEFQTIIKKLQTSSSSFTNQKTQIESLVCKYCHPNYKKRILNEFFESGPLEDLKKIEQLTEILIHDKNTIFFEQSGKMNKLKDQFLSDITYNLFIEKLLQKSGTDLNLKQPFINSKWKDFRVHIVREPISNTKKIISLRKASKKNFNFDTLKAQNWGPLTSIQVIQKWIQERDNILIVGPTGSGKTSLLNACLKQIPQLERCIAIEDTDEIQIPNTISCKLLTRTATEALTEITQNELVKQSLRMRPDRLILGEVRGAEAKDLLLALSSGHTGSLGTLHANSYKQAIWKLEMLVQLGSPQWKTESIQKLIFLSLNSIIVLDKNKKGLPYLKSLHKITGLEKTGLLFETLYSKKTNL